MWIKAWKYLINTDQVEFIEVYEDRYALIFSRASVVLGRNEFDAKEWDDLGKTLDGLVKSRAKAKKNK